MFKKLWQRFGPNPFDQLLKRAQLANKKTFLICWNRGLGDIPLGLYALTQRIRDFIPHAEITFATRVDLADGFQLLSGVSTIVDPRWKRGVAFDVDATLRTVNLDRAHFDVILEKPDPTRWLMWQLGSLTPKLVWQDKWDILCERFPFQRGKKYVGVHVQTETCYAYEKNWPEHYWRELFARAVLEHNVEFVLFGFAPTPSFEGDGILDVRGQTSLFEMLSIIKNKCHYLLVPDSGILSIAYYIDHLFPIEVVSLWADAKQGVLKQKVASPNPAFQHRPLLAKREDLRSLSVDRVMQELFVNR